MTVEITGGEKLAALSRALRAAGETGLKRQLDQDVHKAVAPLPAAIRASALATLPRRGGLAAKVAGSKVTIRRRSGAVNPGIRVSTTHPFRIGKMDRGAFRHPVFADTSKTRDQWTWVEQKVPPGWWTTPTDRVRPQVVRAVEDAIEAVARNIDVEVDKA